MATDSTERLVPGVGLPRHVVEDIRSDPRRRIMLSCLADRGAMVVDELAAVVSARETERGPEEIPASEREACRAELYDEHLPKLTATGVVQYDSMRERVELVAPGIVDGE